MCYQYYPYLILSPNSSSLRQFTRPTAPLESLATTHSLLLTVVEPRADNFSFRGSTQSVLNPETNTVSSSTTRQSYELICCNRISTFRTPLQFPIYIFMPITYFSFFLLNMKHSVWLKHDAKYSNQFFFVKHTNEENCNSKDLFAMHNKLHWLKLDFTDIQLC